MKKGSRKYTDKNHQRKQKIKNITNKRLKGKDSLTDKKSTTEK